MKEKHVNFNELGLDKLILKALDAQGYEKPTPIQSKAIPPILEGRDVVGMAQTGTGKTAAFTLPLLQRLTQSKSAAAHKTVRSLILSPTRELAAQIHKAVRDYSRNMSMTSTCVVGGMSIKPQRKALLNGVDILIATPGRLLDLADQNALRLDAVETFVLDEADQMLDIGFMPAIRRILSMVPNDRQTLLFSATMPKAIRELSARHLQDPVEVSVAAKAPTADKIEQSVRHLTREQKVGVVTDLIRAHDGQRVIVFTRTKRGADKVARRLASDGLNAAAIHGNKSQGQRKRALDAFRKGSCPVLIATDIAARGIDVPDVGLVINYELPNVPEIYIHRIGRTARAGASGVAVSFCSSEERSCLRDIERLIKYRIPEVGADGEIVATVDQVADARPAPKKKGPSNKQRWSSKKKNFARKKRSDNKPSRAA